MLSYSVEQVLLSTVHENQRTLLVFCVNTATGEYDTGNSIRVVKKALWTPSQGSLLHYSKWEAMGQEITCAPSQKRAAHWRGTENSPTSPLQLHHLSQVICRTFSEHWPLPTIQILTPEDCLKRWKTAYITPSSTLTHRLLVSSLWPCSGCCCIAFF